MPSYGICVLTPFTYSFAYNSCTNDKLYAKKCILNAYKHHILYRVEGFLYAELQTPNISIRDPGPAINLEPDSVVMK